VRWTVVVGSAFDEARFADALAGFRRLYNVRPERVLCAPDVLARFAALHARSGDDAFARDLRHEGLPVVSAILAPGTVVFEGSVDDVRMGDW
jgi:phospholipase C